MTKRPPTTETRIVLRTIFSAGVLAVLLLACAGTAAGATWVVDDDSDGINDSDRIGNTILSISQKDAESLSLTTSNGAMLIDRTHGEWFDVSGFTDYLVSHGWIVDQLSTGPIDINKIEEYDIFLIAPAGTPFSSSEINDIKTYVEQGGGLWVFNEYHGLTTANLVSSEFGVTFNSGDWVYDPTNNVDGNIGWPLIHILEVHAITEGVGSFGYYAGSSLNVNLPSKIIAKGDGDAYSKYHSSYPPVLAAVEYGAGKGVFSGDTTPLHPNYYPERLTADEKLLLSNIVNWLSGAPTPPPENPLSVEITSPNDGDQIIEDEDATFSSLVSGGIPPYTIMWSAKRSGKFEFVFSNLQNFDMNFYNRYGDDIKIFQPSGDCMISLVVIDSVGTTAISDFVFVHIVPPKPEVSYEVWQNGKKIVDYMPDKNFPYQFRFKITNTDDNPHYYSLKLEKEPSNDIPTNLNWDPDPKTYVISNYMKTIKIDPGDTEDFQFWYTFKSDWNWIPPKKTVGLILTDLSMKVIKELCKKIIDAATGIGFDIFKIMQIYEDYNIGVPKATFKFVVDESSTTPTLFSLGDSAETILFVGKDKTDHYTFHLIDRLMTIGLWKVYWIAGAAGVMDSAYQYNKAIDPVPDYTQIVQPEPFIVPEIDSIPDGLYKNIAKESFEMLSYSRAEEISYIRYAGAVEDDAYEHAVLQLNAAKEYNDKSLEKIVIINNLFRIILHDEKPLTYEQIEYYKNKIKTEGLPSEAVSILTREGLLDEIPGIIQMITIADPDLLSDPSLILDYYNLIAKLRSDLSSEYIKEITEIKVDLLGQPVGDANPSDLEEIERLKTDIQSGLDKGYATQELKDNIQSMIDLSNAIIIQTNNNDYLHYYSFATDAQVRYLTLQMPIDIYFLPPITTMDKFNFKDGTTLPIKFTARDNDTDEFIYDDTVNVTITNSTGHLIAFFTNGTGTDSVRINSAEGQYIVNFHTKDYDLNVGETYTIYVTFGEADALWGYAITHFTLVDLNH